MVWKRFRIIGLLRGTLQATGGSPHNWVVMRSLGDLFVVYHYGEVEQKVELPVSYNVMTLVWRHGYVAVRLKYSESLPKPVPQKW